MSAHGLEVPYGAPKKRARARVTNMLHQIKGGRDRYEYVFTIGKMLIESWNMPAGRGGVVAGKRARLSRVGDIYQPGSAHQPSLSSKSPAEGGHHNV